MMCYIIGVLACLAIRGYCIVNLEFSADQKVAIKLFRT